MGSSNEMYEKTIFECSMKKKAAVLRSILKLKSTTTHLKGTLYNFNL